MNYLHTAEELVQLQRGMLDEIVCGDVELDGEFWTRFDILTKQFLECMIAVEQKPARLRGWP